jgi:hypothetical protein
VSPVDGRGDGDPGEQPVAASSRPRPLAVLAVLAAAALLLVVTLPDRGDDGGRGTDQASAGPTPRSTDDAARVEKLATAPGAHLWQLAVGRDGSRAAVWNSGDAYALAIDTDEGRGPRELVPRPDVLEAVPGGYLLGNPEGMEGLRLVSPDGASTPVALNGDAVEPEPGDLVFYLQDGLVLYRPRDTAVHDLPALPRGELSAGWVTPDGVLVGTSYDRTRRGVSRAVRRDGRWELTRLSGPGTLTGEVVGYGDRVAVAVVSSSSPTRPIEVVQTTADGGRTWHDVSAAARSLRTLGSAAMADDGTLLLTNAGGTRVDRISAAGDSQRLSGAPPVLLRANAGDRIWAVDAQTQSGSMYSSSDLGQTWQRVRFPGQPPCRRQR